MIVWNRKRGEKIKNCKNAASDPQQKPFEGAAATEKVTREHINAF